MKLEESLINRTTSHHVARLLGKFEERFPSMSLAVREFIRKEVRKEFWLLSLNFRKELFNRELLDQDDPDRGYNPELDK